MQLPLWQSDPRAQNWWMPQRGHAFVPPQSTSVSPWFWMPSTQFAAMTWAACAWHAPPTGTMPVPVIAVRARVSPRVVPRGAL